MSGAQDADSASSERRQEPKPLGIRCSGSNRRPCVGDRERHAMPVRSRPDHIAPTGLVDRIPFREWRREREQLAVRGGVADRRDGAARIGRKVRRCGDSKERESQHGDERPGEDVGRKRQKEARAPPRIAPVAGHGRTIDSSIGLEPRQSSIRPLPGPHALPPSCVPATMRTHLDDGAAWRFIA